MIIWVDANGWPVPPVLLLGCLVAEILYWRGWYRLTVWARSKGASSSGLSRKMAGKEQETIWLWRGGFFLGALFVFLLAASAPIDLLSERFFWVHMIQHLLLLVIMAPLLLASVPLLPLWLGLPVPARCLCKALLRRGLRRALLFLVHRLRQPAISCVLLIAGTWIWHWPALYDLALRNDFIHDWGEHTTFLLVSLLFWSQVIPSQPLRPRVGYIGQMGCIGVAIVQNVVFAAIVGFAQVPLYAPYLHMAQGSLAALQDQQIGAGIMWTFGDLPYGIAFSVLMQRWLASVSDEPALTMTTSPRMER